MLEGAAGEVQIPAGSIDLLPAQLTAEHVHKSSRPNLRLVPTQKVNGLPRHLPTVGNGELPAVKRCRSKHARSRRNDLTAEVAAYDVDRVPGKLPRPNVDAGATDDANASGHVVVRDHVETDGNTTGSSEQESQVVAAGVVREHIEAVLPPIYLGQGACHYGLRPAVCGNSPADAGNLTRDRVAGDGAHQPEI